MKTSDKGLAFIAGHEGIVPYPYRDSVGVWTWGVGHTHYAGAPDPRTMPRGVESSISEVMAVFARDIAKYERDVDAAIRVPVSQHEFDAAVSFHYNTGAIGRANWVKTLNAGNRSGAADQFLNWSKPREIIPRRTAEMRLFETGAYGDGFANVYRATSSGSVVWGSANRVRVLDYLEPPASIPAPPVEDPRYPTLRQGDSGDAVRELQELLLSKGYDLGAWGADGDFGPTTQHAVVMFQNKLMRYGEVGQFTWAALLA